MIKYLIILVIGGNKVLVRKRRFGGKEWEFVERILGHNENWSDATFSYATSNFDSSEIEEIKKFGGHEFEETGDIEEFWIIKLKGIPKLPRSLLYKYDWVGAEDDREYGPEVLYYIKKYFGL